MKLPSIYWVLDSPVGGKCTEQTGLYVYTVLNKPELKSYTNDMKREDFKFTIGYQGETALIDKSAKTEFGKLSFEELLDKGLFKPAFCHVLFEDDTQGMEKVLARVNEDSQERYENIDQLKRLFGVFQPPEEGIKVKYL